MQRRRAARRPSAQAHARARRSAAGKAPRAPRAPRKAGAKSAAPRRYHYEGLMVDYFTRAIGGPVGPRKAVVHLDVPIIDARTGRLRHKQKIEWDLYLLPTPARPGVVIECQGVGHYRPVAAWGGVRGFIGQLRRDEVKRREARRRGYYYIEISNTHAADPTRVCGEPEFMRRLANALRGWHVHLDFWRAARAEAFERMAPSAPPPRPPTYSAAEIAALLAKDAQAALLDKDAPNDDASEASESASEDEDAAESAEPGSREAPIVVE